MKAYLSVVKERGGECRCCPDKAVRGRGRRKRSKMSAIKEQTD